MQQASTQACNPAFCLCIGQVQADASSLSEAHARFATPITSGSCTVVQVVHVDIVFLVLVTSISMPLFYEDTKYFVHDTKAGLYRPLEYLLARMTVAIPFTIIMGAVLHFILFGMAGMRHGAVYMLQSCALAVLCLLIAMQVWMKELCAARLSMAAVAFIHGMLGIPR
eukprot:GHUV01021094.1.p2 GENE.GHUV01021094.1~~GHUV01021094.1.p2  ORF type:complete len:168 (-),score=18.09 GHUV01021094.1:498-1001(-)